ncbi:MULTISPECIES: type II toxin-antitoxin system VapC family toxin [unclassified Streptomyces]|uniref:type II toxin-antitoxin system VapC family toxin n=1 Tax=unclassified Streptomyces TaxID=2593676 RepID=UPI00190A51E2|nr:MULTISPECIES: type II toxin-antitoxin system VapC family toxin [unclassified Streptomyces]MBK3571376.1 type II toxin-antitoxin system VapC family toxin [Streptomyces sp. MBT62]MBK6011145.1 type II toxin-antitoxin system VapC family toxin [Streptomyces sp. MBT53]
MTLLYLDASAIAKLLRAEAETTALEQWIGRHGGMRRVVTCDLAQTEVRRLLHRLGADEVERSAADALLNAIAHVRLTPELMLEAGELAPGSALRSLDAIHAVAALKLGHGVSWFVTYDKRQGEAAADAGLPVASPR